jgi:hypothetical protein
MHKDFIMLDRLERWWNRLGDNLQMIIIVIAFLLMLVANPFIN